MAEGTLLQQMMARAEERQTDAAFLRSVGIAPIEETEASKQDASPAVAH